MKTKNNRKRNFTKIISYLSFALLITLMVRSKLEKSEASGFTADSKENILAQSKSLFNG